MKKKKMSEIKEEDEKMKDDHSKDINMQQLHNYIPELDTKSPINQNSDDVDEKHAKSFMFPMDNIVAPDEYSSKSDKSSLQKLVKIVLYVFNFTGLTTMSMDRVLKRNWKSFRLFHCIVISIFHFLTIGTEIVVIMNEINKTKDNTTNSDVGRSVIIRLNYIQKSIHHIMIFVFLERSYKSLAILLNEWTKMEKNHGKHYGDDNGWKKRFFTTFIILLSLRLIAWPIGHVFRLIFTGRRIGFTEYLRLYIKNSRKGMYLIFGGSEVASAICLLIANMSTLDWEVLTLYFLVMMSLIRQKWKIMHRSLLFKVKNNIEEIDWEVTRNDYVHLVDCTNKIDDAFSPMILVYVVTGVYWLLVRLHLGITGKAYQVAYRCFFFGHIAGLLFAVIISAASIIDWTEKISEIMDGLNASNFGEKAGRFEERCRQPIRGITGCRFIYLNRSLINMIIGILFTYEVVLLEMA